MSNHITPALDLIGNDYDDCRVASFLKKMFSRQGTTKNPHTVVVSSKISTLKKDLLALSGDEPVELSYSYFHAMEQALPDTVFRYAVIRRADVPVLFVYFQFVSVTAQNFNLQKNTGFVKGILRFFLNLRKAKVLIQGNALRTETASYCYDAAVFSQAEAIEAIAGISEKIASDECASAVVLKDIATRPATARKLVTMGFQAPYQDQVMEMDIDKTWDSLASYTTALSRKYKSRANKVIEAGKELTVMQLTTAQITAHKEDIQRLFMEVTNKQSFVLMSSGAEYIISLKKLYGSDFEVVGLFNDGRLVAFYSGFISPDAYELYYVGFDEQLNGTYQLYFNLLFSGLERAILLGKTVLKLGRTSFDAKASLGAKPRELEYYIKIAHVPDTVLQWFVSYFSAMEDGKWKLRNPLKASIAG